MSRTDGGVPAEHAEGGGEGGTGRAIAAASAVAVAALSVAWLAVGTGSGEPRPAAHSELDRASGAIRFYEAKYAANARHPTFGHKLIDFYALRFRGAADPADLRRAEELARELVARARTPAKRSATRARLSGLLLAGHDFEGALAQAGAAVEEDPSEAALAALIDAAAAAGEDSLARAALDRMQTGTVPWLLRAARLDLSEGRLEEALGRMGRAYGRLHESPVPRQTVAWAATMLAEIEARRAGPDVAARWHRRALEIAPGYRGALEGLADLAYARAEWERAENLYRRILAEAHPDLYLRLAEVLRAQGKASEASRLERRFLETTGSPDLERLHARELALFHARDPSTRDLALEIARRELDRRAGTAESWEVMAWVRLRRGEVREALAASERVLEAGEPGRTALYLRARVLEALHRQAEADSLYTAALAEPALLDPHALQDARSTGRLRP